MHSPRPASTGTSIHPNPGAAILPGVIFTEPPVLPALPDEEEEPFTPEEQLQAECASLAEDLHVRLMQTPLLSLKTAREVLFALQAAAAFLARCEPATP